MIWTVRRDGTYLYQAVIVHRSRLGALDQGECLLETKVIEVGGCGFDACGEHGHDLRVLASSLCLLEKGHETVRHKPG